MHVLECIISERERERERVRGGDEELRRPQKIKKNKKKNEPTKYTVHE